MLLFALTFFTTTTLGGIFAVVSRTDLTTDLGLFLTPATVRAVWTEPALLAWGLSFALPTLVILLAHELGHWFACRRHALPATPPYFIPAPLGLGTFGAFIRIRAAIRGKRQLLDVGVSGPIAGFLVLLPFLVWGVARSQPVTLAVTGDLDASAVWLYRPGSNLLTTLVVTALHGSRAVDTLNPHPFLLAAWVGMFATMLNLLPLAQLDGGHVLYAAAGRWQRRLAWPLWAALALLGLRWPGWWVWCGIVLVLGLRHPPVLDERSPLDRRGRWLVATAALIFALCFLPVPIRIVALLGE
ncbi:MAG: site-2 protease family protein [Thermoanaerobaculia bacterium]|nr:site-2 protease family protein [Thermoanaerobaculia bacterium]